MNMTVRAKLCPNVVLTVGHIPRSSPSGDLRLSASALYSGNHSSVRFVQHVRSRVQWVSGSSVACKGGALGSQMNVFERLGRIVKSYANAALSSLEDPEKILDTTVEEMGEDLAKMRQATAQVIASQKIMENKYKQASQMSDDWYRRARLALEKGEEELAKEALKRRKSFEDNANSLRSQLDQQKETVDKLIQSTKMLEAKISEAKAKKDTLKARAQSAKTSKKVNELIGNVSTTSAFAAFEKMEEKVIALEAESDSVSQLATDDIATKFAMLESGGGVDDDLAQLRREISGTSSKPSALPEGRSFQAATAGTISAKDLEIEAELNDLRRKARGL